MARRRRRWCAARLKLTGAVRRTGRHASPRSCSRRTSSAWTPAWTALTQQVPRRFIGIYTDQSNQVVDAWVLRGPPALRRGPAVRPRRRRQGHRRARCARATSLYLLPDMNFGPRGIDLRAVLRRAGGHGAVAVALRAAGPGQGGAGGHAPHARAATRCGCCRPGTTFPTGRRRGRHRADERAAAGLHRRRCPSSTTGCTSASRRARRASRRSIEPALRAGRPPSSLAPRTPGCSWTIQWVAPGTFSSVELRHVVVEAVDQLRRQRRVVHRPQHQRGHVHREHLARQRDRRPRRILRRAAAAAARRGSSCRPPVRLGIPDLAVLRASRSSVSQRRAAPVA